MSSLSLASLYQDRGIYCVSQIVFVRASDLITKFAFVTTPQREKKCALIFNHMNVTLRGGTLGISGWGCAAGTLEPLTYTRASSAEFCYPIL